MQDMTGTYTGDADVRAAASGEAAVDDTSEGPLASGLAGEEEVATEAALDGVSFCEVT